MSILTQIRHFLLLIRWFHSLLALFPFVSIFLILKFDPGFSSCNFSTFDFFMLCLGVEFILISGVVHNDMMDVGIDEINKADKRSINRTVSYEYAKHVFIAFSFASLAVSVYIVLAISPTWLLIGVGSYFLSIIYNSFLKRLPLIGNIVMALIAAAVPLVIPLFVSDCLKQLENPKIEILIYVYSALTFFVTVPRELSLDISDMDGDKLSNFRTLPIVIGIRKSKMVVSALLMIPIILSLFTLIQFRHLIVPLTLMNVGFIYYLYELQKVAIRSEYVRIGKYLWISMIIGMVGSAIATF